MKKTAIWIVWGLLLAIFIAPIAHNIYEHLSAPPVPIPDEQIAGQDLLAQKFTGPRYFQPNVQADGSQSPADKYYISVAAAKAQLLRIAEERKLTADESAKIQAVIEKIAEPPPSRVTGQTGVNVLRLNLALDALR